MLPASIHPVTKNIPSTKPAPAPASDFALRALCRLGPDSVARLQLAGLHQVCHGMEVAFSNRQIHMHTEDNLVVAPSEFWSEQLCAKIRDIAKTTSKPSRPDSSTIVVSVNEISEPAITKSFTEVEVDWAAVERQLQAWSHLLRIGEEAKGRGATAAQLADADVLARCGTSVARRPIAVSKSSVAQDRHVTVDRTAG
ncbi:hypothetical protein ACCO45_010031 [Purpureocillium lilacinum]|uniref:Uncharacterized protein n=1 Tax=Purpureocillium lilacinum TaxID=33203 RepID=A0ACC4DEH0_PURLI